jgi:uncharacterized protein DUF222
MFEVATTAPAWSELEAYPDDPSTLTDDQVEAGFADLQRMSEAVEAKRLRWLAELERRSSYSKDGHLSAAAWLSDRHGVAAGAAKTQVKVALALREMPEVAHAFMGGEVTSSAVRILAEAREEHPSAFANQEAALVEAAQTKGVEELRRVAADWCRAVSAEEASRQGERLRERRRLDLGVMSTGMVRVTGELDPESGEVVLTALQALVDAGLRADHGMDLRTSSQRRADALAELALRYLDSPDRPTVGGERPHVTVTMDVQTLKGLPGVSELDHVGAIHGEVARRVACDASLTRVVMAGPSEPLEVGRKTPVVPGALRKAVVIRDKRCRFPRCHRPHAWCDAHHIRHWADGGETNLSNLLLMCRPHHRLVHEGGFGLGMVDGRPVFRRPDGSVIEDGRAPP